MTYENYSNIVTDQVLANMIISRDNLIQTLQSGIFMEKDVRDRATM